jgi:Uma2 family endonuclease
MPDMFIAIGPESKYRNRHPEPDDLVLVVEVSNTSLGVDRTVKLALYAAEGIPQYWIIDVKARRIEVYTQPRGGKKPGFKKKVVYAKDVDVPIAIGEKHLGAISVAKLLP